MVNSTHFPTLFESLRLAINYFLFAIWTPGLRGILLLSQALGGNSEEKFFLPNLAIIGFFLTLTLTLGTGHLIRKRGLSWNTALLLGIPPILFLTIITPSLDLKFFRIYIAWLN